MAVVSAGMGAMSSLLGKLSALLGDEYKLLKGVRKDVELLKRELSRMEALLQTLAGMEKLDALHKDWRNNVRELSYDIEDCIDLYVHHLGSGDADAGFMKKFVRRLKALWTRHNITSQIKELKVRVLEESQRRDRYKLDSSISRPTTVDIDPRLPALYAEAKGLVAIDGPRDQIVRWLMDETVELKVVSIVGCGGLGKTTLAMEVYRKIEGNFQCRASVSVSRTLDLNKLLKDVLFQIDKVEYSKCQSEMWEKEQLIRKLRHIFTGKRYFIVIDDVWRIQDWKFVESVFPENNNGSRIIVTTRITDVAKSCCSNSGDQLHQMAHLDDVDSRRLFFKRIFHSDNSCPTELEKVSDEILKKCGGLPLAIITIASLLATKPQNKNEWERLQDSMGIGSSHENDPSLQGIKDILFLSYCDLPHHLKTCLLYISIYPEDYEIESKELIWKWIAEGFITKQGRSLEQVAKGYLIDLVNRSMIQASVDDDGSVSTCWVHDLVLDLIISLSEDENFVTILDGHECNSLPSKIRRLSLQSDDTEHSTILATTQSKSHIRSLNVFGALEQIPPLVDFHALRVLDLSRCEWLENKHIKNLGSLFQLRYLHLASEDITELPEEIGNLQYLLTLDLSDCRNITRLPSTIVRLKELVRLIVNDSATFTGDEFGSMHALEELQTVSRFDNPIRFAEELRHLTKLRSLYMRSIGPFRMSGDRERFAEVLSSSLSELGRSNLRYLEITDNCLFKNTSCTFPHLQLLKINGSIPGVPREMASLTNLVKLNIFCRNFEDEDLHVLMGLPSLTHLELALYGHGKDTDKMITVGSSGFRLLEEFVCFSRSRTMLVFGPGATPALQRLKVHISERETLSKYCGGAGFGIEHLTKLMHFEVRTHFCDLTPTQGEIRALADAINRETTSHPYRQTLLVEIHANVPGPNNSCQVQHYLQVFLRSRNGGSPYEIVQGKAYMKDWREHGFICSPADYDLSEYFLDESQQDFEQEDDNVDFVEDCDE